jgi:hypothetical protein
MNIQMDRTSRLRRYKEAIFMSGAAVAVVLSELIRNLRLGDTFHPVTVVIGICNLLCLMHSIWQYFKIKRTAE